MFVSKHQLVGLLRRYLATHAAANGGVRCECPLCVETRALLEALGRRWAAIMRQ